MESITQKSPTVLVAESAAAIAGAVATEIADLIESRNAAGLSTTLGLATGNTPILLYRELIRLAHARKLDFSQVTTFNLDEYYPIDPASPHSYHFFMRTHLFDQLPLSLAQTHVPDGTVARAAVAAYCAGYERQIAQAGGLNFLLLGIGENGHIGFNEPGAERESRTRLVTLDAITRKNAAADFGREVNVPHEAITMGIATILEAQRIVLLAQGSKKASAILQAVAGPVSACVPASYLHLHGNATIYLDPAAASQLPPL